MAEISSIFEEIWMIGTKRCVGCGLLKAIYTKNRCYDCFCKKRKEESVTPENRQYTQFEDAQCSA